MDKKHINRELSENYIITDMIIFTLFSIMSILLILDCLRVYSYTKSDILNHFLSNKENIVKSKLNFEIEKSKFNIQIYEKKILKHIKFNLNFIKEIHDQDFFYSHWPIKNENIKNNNLLIKKLQANIDNKNFYFILNSNELLICKNIFFNQKIIGVAIDKIKSNMNDFENIKDIINFSITDGKILYQIIGKQDLIDEKTYIHDLNQRNQYFLLDIFSGKNMVISRLTDNLLIQIELDKNFIKNKIYINFLSRFFEVVSFCLFFFILIILIIKKDKERNTHSEILKENAIKANKAKSDFLAYTAHEIRSPLGFIITGTDMIDSGLLGDISNKCREYVRGINLNAKMILNHISEILDENKILQRKFSYNRDYHNINEIISEVIEHNKTKFYFKQIEIKSKLANNLPKLYCDDKKIFQVINNLITNACKYSESNIPIYIQTYIEDNKICILIKDQGIGMDKEELESVINFNKISNLNSKPDSYGLGLNIVEMILESHDAKFYIDSKKNIGTEVRIVFNQKI